MPNSSTAQFAGKSAIITGSTSGIGLAIARAFAGGGMNVMLNGFGEPDEIEATRAGIEQECGVKALHSKADMTRPDEIAQMVEDATRAFGQVDVMVNNAGIQHVEAIETFPPEKWDAIIAINLTAVFHGTRAVLGGMKQRGWGRIINMASVHGLVASPYKSAYNAAKHGVIGLTKTVALEAAESGVTVNAICPGYVLTPLVERQIPEQAQLRGMTEDEVVNNVMLAVQPTRKFVTIEQVSGLAVFLCSDAAASITGTSLPVDGGWTAQ
jgi:3-hydroxybutyrate dehydrogenase